MIEIPGYRILQHVASGSSGTVYKAVQLELTRQVALKVLAPGLFDAKETRARFLREARLQAKLAHVNLLALYDAGFAGDSPYLATAFIEGGSLREVLAREGPLALSEVLRLGGEIAAGLAHAHQAGIVHRDLKPENVLFTAERQAKIADFGLAKTRSVDQTVQTATGTILGTPGYMAPEMIDAMEATAAADVYALGAILFEMAAGRRAFEGEDPGEILRAQLDADPPPLRTLRPEAPASLDTLVAACLEREAARRPASASAVLERLAAVEAEVASAVRKASSGRRTRTGSSSSSPVIHKTAVSVAGQAVSRAATVLSRPVPVVHPRASGRRWWAVAGAASALVGLAFVAGWFTARTPEPDRPKPRTSPALSAGPATTGRPPPPSIRGLGRPMSLRRRSDGTTVAIGADRIRLWFREPLATTATVSWWPRGTSTRTKRTLAAGLQDCTLERLQPATAYELETEVNGQRPVAGFAVTLAPATDLADGCQLPAPGLAADRLAILAVGPKVFVTWVSSAGGGDTPRYVARTAASFDAGQTWTTARSTHELGADNGFVGLSACPNVVQSFWTHSGPDRVFTARTCALDDSTLGAKRVSPLVQSPLAHPEGMDVTGSPDGSSDVLVCLRPAAEGPHSVFWTRFFPGALGGTPPELAFTPPEHDWIRVVQTGERLVAVVHRPRLPDRNPICWFSLRDLAPGAVWDPLKPLLTEEENVDWADLFAWKGRAILSYESAVSGWLRVLAPERREFSRPIACGDILGRQFSPTLAADDRLYVASATWDVLGSCNLQVIRSEDGKVWTPHAKATLSRRKPFRVRLAAAGSHLVAAIGNHGGTVSVLRIPK